jgi:hypothetical protein
MGKAFARISKGLQQAIAHLRGERVRGMRLHVPEKMDVNVVRRHSRRTNRSSRP